MKRKINYKHYNKIYKRTLITVFFVFFLMLLLFALILFLIIRFESSNLNLVKTNSVTVFFTCVIVALLLISQSISIYWINRVTKPIEEITKVADQIAQGNFDVSINTRGFKNEMRDLGTNLNTMIAQIKSIEVMRSDFVSNVSHEFKAPLSAIQGYVTLLSNPTLSDEKRHKYFTLLSQSVTQMSGLVDNVLRLSKLESESSPPKKAVFRLDEQLRRSVLMFEKTWLEKELEPELDLPDCSYNGNEELLGQMWVNLIGNAVKYCEKGDTFGIKIDNEDDNEIKVIVYDSGIGMSAEVRQHVFEKFYQGDTSHKEKGNGLGLALVKTICKLTDCEIEVKSEIGKGSTFTVTMPKQ